MSFRIIKLVRALLFYNLFNTTIGTWIDGISNPHYFELESKADEAINEGPLKRQRTRQSSSPSPDSNGSNNNNNDNHKKDTHAEERTKLLQQIAEGKKREESLQRKIEEQQQQFEKSGSSNSEDKSNFEQLKKQNEKLLEQIQGLQVLYYDQGIYPFYLHFFLFDYIKLFWSIIIVSPYF